MVQMRNSLLEAEDALWGLVCDKSLGQGRAYLGAFECLVTTSIMSHVFLMLKSLGRFS